MGHYKHSGRAPFSAWALALLAGSAAAAALGGVYGYTLAYVPFVGKITFVLAAGFGALVGALTGYLFRKGHGRSTGLGLLAGLVVTTVGFYFAWASWIHAVLNRGSVEVSFFDVLAPDALWETILRINEVGAWSMRGNTPTGGTLWALWGIEALLIFVAAMFASAELAGGGVYCENCRTWCAEREGAVLLNPGPHDELRARFNAHDWSVVQQLGPLAPGGNPTLRLDLASCPGCGQTHTASVLELRNDGQQTHTEKLVEGLLLSPDEARWLGSLQPAGTAPGA